MDKNKLAKLLTGEHITGLSENSEFQNVADELEGDEYVQFPDNTTQRVEGKKHTQGGEDMVLPNGTKVLTASIKIGARDAKRLSDQHGFKINKDDTYAKVLDKYKKHVGLRKIYDEQEQYIKELDKVEKSDADAGTLGINREFLSSKINDIEQKKTALEQGKSEFFKTLYDLQEQKKEGKAKYQQEGMMKYGGTLKPKREKIKFKVGGKKYQYAGEIGEPKDYAGRIFRVIARDPTYTKGDRVRQDTKQEGTYGTLSNEESVRQGLENLQQQFPIEFSTVFGEGVDMDNLVKDVIDKKNKGEINKLQENILKRQKKQANFILDDKNKDYFGEDERKLAQEYLDNETFLEGELEDAPEDLRVRKLDNMLGNFTSTRFSLALSLVTPEDLKALREAGVYTTQQIKDSGVELSDESKRMLEEYNKIAGEDDPNFSLFEFDLQDPADEGDPDKKTPNIVGENPVRQVNQRYPRAYYTPDQSVLTPGGLEAHLKETYRGQTQDAPIVGVEPQLQQAATQRMQASEQLRDLPTMQRAAAIAYMAGQLQQAENQTITTANRINAENLARTELWNAQQRNEESIRAGNNALNYENRQMTAKAKTDEELRNYLDYNRKVALTNFRNTQDRNLISSVFPDYDTDFYGMTPVYEPEDPNWTTQERANYLRLMRATGNQLT